MAILSSSGIYSFLCSCKKVAGEYLEHFKSGFAGYGWKIWERWPGKWCFEIDDMVVRGKMTVFEMIISKIRFIRGALGITQANGTVKAVADMEDSFKLTIDEEMSFVADDFIKCQQFSNGIHGYHVKVDRIEGNMIVILKSEFNKDADGNVSDPPRVGDELVQFGNQTDQTRQSAIYLHADEGGQPSIDVMFGINSKDWTGCVKISLGGSIPGHEGFNGFYCENGMVLSVDEKKEVIYKFSPDGSFSLGRGKISYDPKTDKVNLNGVTLDWGEIENAPTPEPGKPGKTTYTWIAYADNADGSGMYQIPKDSTKYIGIAVNKDTATEGINPAEYTWNLFKGTDGKPGTDANLLPWVQEYENNKTLIDGEYVISPKMFSGTSRIDENGKQWLTGIAMGRDCITDPDGTKRTGIFAVVDNEVIFELDPITKKYVFKGRVEADEGVFNGSISTPFLWNRDIDFSMGCNYAYIGLNPRSVILPSVFPYIGTVCRIYDSGSSMVFVHITGNICARGSIFNTVKLHPGCIAQFISVDVMTVDGSKQVAWLLENASEFNIEGGNTLISKTSFA